ADQHVRLVQPAVRERQRPLAVLQRDPGSAAVGREARDVEPAVVEWALAPRAVRAPRPVTDELVDVVAVLVVAGVDDDPSVRLGEGRTLVLEAPECRALDRHRARSKGIDLDAPAEVVQLVPVPRQIEARFGPVPAVT